MLELTLELTLELSGFVVTAVSKVSDIFVGSSSFVFREDDDDNLGNSTSFSSTTGLVTRFFIVVKSFDLGIAFVAVPSLFLKVAGVLSGPDTSKLG